MQPGIQLKRNGSVMTSRPRALLFTLSDAPPTVHTLTLQKKNGTYDLLIWNEVRNFDDTSKEDLYPEPVSVTVNFTTPVLEQATVLTQNEQGSRDPSPATVQNQTLHLNVPSSVLIVRLQPASGGTTDSGPAPNNLSGTATENSVHLTWDPPANSDKNTGYFIYRNGGHIATTAANSFDDTSAWILPGFGLQLCGSEL